MSEAKSLGFSFLKGSRSSAFRWVYKELLISSQATYVKLKQSFNALVIETRPVMETRGEREAYLFHPRLHM